MPSDIHIYTFVANLVSGRAGQFFCPVQVSYRRDKIIRNCTDLEKELPIVIEKWGRRCDKIGSPVERIYSGYGDAGIMMGRRLICTTWNKDTQGEATSREFIDATFNADFSISIVRSAGFPSVCGEQVTPLAYAEYVPNARVIASRNAGAILRNFCEKNRTRTNPSAGELKALAVQANSTDFRTSDRQNNFSWLPRSTRRRNDTRFSRCKDDNNDQVITTVEQRLSNWAAPEIEPIRKRYNFAEERRQYREAVTVTYDRSEAAYAVLNPDSPLKVIRLIRDGISQPEEFLLEKGGVYIAVAEDAHPSVRENLDRIAQQTFDTWDWE